MNKIPTLFQRNPNDMKHVLRTVTPGCEWVLAGEGTPTRKYDGTCVMIDKEGLAWTRREVKPGKLAPADWIVVETDKNTGKTVGWEPYEASGYAKYVEEALERGMYRLPAGTYELVGPKVQGNPEHFNWHVLIPHGEWELYGVPHTYGGLAKYLTDDDFVYEGIVWHHSDGRMAKLKKRDFQ